MRKLIWTVLSLTPSLLACASHKIPGTEIDDNTDTRAIFGLMNAYRQAVEARDADAIVALLDESFRDDGGTTNLDDDLTYAKARTSLTERLKRFEDVRLEMNLRKIEFVDDETAARATYTYSVTYRIPQLTSRTQTDAEIKQMNFKRVGKKDWRIVSGI